MAKKLKTWKMRGKHCRTYIMARNTQKRGKLEMQNCKTWNIAKKLKIMENENTNCRR
jgi:hypothetical protein